jgi:hypothetical protein
MATRSVSKRRKKLGDKISEEEGQALFDSVMRCKPLIAKADMERLEAQMNGAGALAIARRLGLAAAIQDGEWYAKLSKDREMAVVMGGQLNAMQDAAAVLKEVAGLIESAEWRIKLALCNHADMQQILTEGRQHAVLEG